MKAKKKKAPLEVIRSSDDLGYDAMSGTLPGDHRTTGKSTTRDMDEKAEPLKFKDSELVNKPTYLASVGSSLLFGDKSATLMNSDVDTRSLETQRMLQKVLRDFPAYDAASDRTIFSGSHLKCHHCEAIFSNRQVCLPRFVNHEADVNMFKATIGNNTTGQSSVREVQWLRTLCILTSMSAPGSIRCLLLTVPLSSSSESGYKIERKLIPFDSKRSEFQCKKCEVVFDTEDEANDHEALRKAYLCHR